MRKLLNSIIESFPLSIIVSFFTREEVWVPFLGFLIVFIIDTILGSYIAIKGRSKDRKPFCSENFSTKMAKKLIIYLIIVLSMAGMGMIVSHVPEVGEYMGSITIALAFFILLYCELVSIQENFKQLGFDIYPLSLVLSIGKRVFEVMGIYIEPKEEKIEPKEEIDNDGRGD